MIMMLLGCTIVETDSIANHSHVGWSLVLLGRFGSFGRPVALLISSIAVSRRGTAVIAVIAIVAMW